MGDNKQTDTQGVSKNTPEHTVDLEVAPCDGSETDSDCEHKFVFPLRHELPPHDYLRFILTVWYSPETSSSIAGPTSNMILQPPVLNVWVLHRTRLHSQRARSTTSSDLANTSTMVRKIAEEVSGNERCTNYTCGTNEVPI
ncbi:hypothetical protein SprV_0100198300 [Sparganum proliferum]